MRDIITLMFALSKVPGLKFVGSCSLFQQGIYESANDIDVLVENLDEINKFFETIPMQEPLYTFTGRQRAYFIENNVLVDVYIQPNNEETVTVNGHVCSTLSAQIAFLEKTLSLNLNTDKRQQVISEINYLKSIRE